MIDTKFNECGSANTETGLPSGDKPQSIALKKTALRDLQNENRIMSSKPLGDPPLWKDRGPFTETDTVKVSGIKRPASDFPQSSPCNHAPNSSGANGHLVYARRKSEQELVKSNNCDKDKSTDCPQQDPREQETPQRRDQIEGPKKSCLSAFTPISLTSPMTSSGGPLIPLNELSPAEPNYRANRVPHPVNSGTDDQHWKERFLRLQTHLRNCDHSSQEEYIQMLQSLSSVGRSKHAVELEKRAIQLLLEEGHELLRMKHLNVLGKSVSTISLSSPLNQQVQTEK